MFNLFFADTRGNVAVMFGLAIVPLMGLVGAALDYSRATEFRTFLHRETDMAALAIASADTPNTDIVLTTLKERVLTHYGPSNAVNPVQNVTIEGAWTGGSNYTLRVNARFSNKILSAVPSMPATMPIKVETEVNRVPPEWEWTLPEISDLSYEAADYNRISVYCYNAMKKDNASKGRRLKTLTGIADNGGTDYSKVKMPNCKEGEMLSYQLRNVRNARTSKPKWDDPAAEHYIYYTDTVGDPNTRILTSTITGGREYADGSMAMTDLTRAPLVETILCDSKAACRSKNVGGILPNNHETGRSPATATGGCAQGKYMYYGFEDRPPVTPGASDTDYDDIRLVVSCPALLKVADKEIKIVR